MRWAARYIKSNQRVMRETISVSIESCLGLMVMNWYALRERGIKTTWKHSTRLQLESVDTIPRNIKILIIVYVADICLICIFLYFSLIFFIIFIGKRTSQTRAWNMCHYLFWIQPIKIIIHFLCLHSTKRITEKEIQWFKWITWNC